MGVPVSYIREYDSKLQIEMLRACRPDRFKTAGVNRGLRDNVATSRRQSVPQIDPQ